MIYTFKITYPNETNTHTVYIDESALHPRLDMQVASSVLKLTRIAYTLVNSRRNSEEGLKKPGIFVLQRYGVGKILHVNNVDKSSLSDFEEFNLQDVPAINAPAISAVCSTTEQEIEVTKNEYLSHSDITNVFTDFGFHLAEKTALFDTLVEEQNNDVKREFTIPTLAKIIAADPYDRKKATTSLGVDWIKHDELAKSSVNFRKNVFITPIEKQLKTLNDDVAGLLTSLQAEDEKHDLNLVCFATGELAALKLQELNKEAQELLQAENARLADCQLEHVVKEHYEFCTQHKSIIPYLHQLLAYYLYEAATKYWNYILNDKQNITSLELKIKRFQETFGDLLKLEITNEKQVSHIDGIYNLLGNISALSGSETLIKQLLLNTNKGYGAATGLIFVHEALEKLNLIFKTDPAFDKDPDVKAITSLFVKADTNTYLGAYWYKTTFAWSPGATTLETNIKKRIEEHTQGDTAKIAQHLNVSDRLSEAAIDNIDNLEANNKLESLKAKIANAHQKFHGAPVIAERRGTVIQPIPTRRSTLSQSQSYDPTGINEIAGNLRSHSAFDIHSNSLNNSPIQPITTADSSIKSVIEAERKVRATAKLKADAAKLLNAAKEQKIKITKTQNNIASFVFSGKSLFEESNIAKGRIEYKLNSLNVAAEAVVATLTSYCKKFETEETKDFDEAYNALATQQAVIEKALEKTSAYSEFHRTLRNYDTLIRTDDFRHFAVHRPKVACSTPEIENLQTGIRTFTADFGTHVETCKTTIKKLSDALIVADDPTKRDPELPVIEKLVAELAAAQAKAEDSIALVKQNEEKLKLVVTDRERELAAAAVLPRLRSKSPTQAPAKVVVAEQEAVATRAPAITSTTNEIDICIKLVTIITDLTFWSERTNYKALGGGTEATYGPQAEIVQTGIAACIEKIKKHLHFGTDLLSAQQLLREISKIGADAAARSGTRFCFFSVRDDAASRFYRLFDGRNKSVEQLNSAIDVWVSKHNKELFVDNRDKSRKLSAA